MERISLTAETRDTKGSRPVNRLRKEGFVPAVLYGKDIEPQSLKIKSSEIEKAYHRSANALINLTIANDSQLAIISEIQKDAIKGTIRHVDFHRINMTDKLHLSVALHIEGEAPGVKSQGGQLEIIHRHLMVECLPSDIPDAIHLSVANLNLNEAIHVKDIALPTGVKALAPADEVMVRVVPVKAMEEAPVAATTEEAASPAATAPAATTPAAPAATPTKK